MHRLNAKLKAEIDEEVDSYCSHITNLVTTLNKSIKKSTEFYEIYKQEDPISRHFGADDRQIQTPCPTRFHYRQRMLKDGLIFASTIEKYALAAPKERRPHLAWIRSYNFRLAIITRQKIECEKVQTVPKRTT